jgi:hypothetical protein
METWIQWITKAPSKRIARGPAWQLQQQRAKTEKGYFQRVRQTDRSIAPRHTWEGDLAQGIARQADTLRAPSGSPRLRTKRRRF